MTDSGKYMALLLEVTYSCPRWSLVWVLLYYSDFTLIRQIGSSGAGVGKFGPRVAVLQSLAPTLIKHTWTS